jgi:dTDP-4-amino-4,6-dideoxygalactose transaminase
MDHTGVLSKPFELDSDFAVSLAADVADARRRLESRLANHVGAEFCALMPGGTAGMLAALRAAEVGEGDTVLCTAFSYLSTAEIIAMTGARPRFADINPNNFNLDPYCLEYALKKCNRRDTPMPKAVVAADLFGLPCDYGELEDICTRYGVVLIEDMSCAFGASYRGKKAGNFGRFAVASFFPARPLGDEGEGGGVFCHSREDLRKLESLRLGAAGESASAGFVRTSLVGEKLGAYAGELSKRQLIAARYRQNLKDAVRVQQVGEEFISAYTQFAIELEDERGRSALAEALREKRIPFGIVNPGTKHAKAPARGNGKTDRTLPANTADAAKRLMTIPINPHMSTRVADYISECILAAVKDG